MKTEPIENQACQACREKPATMRKWHLMTAYPLCAECMAELNRRDEAFLNIEK